ncbi:ArsR family transcriptional regulator [Brachybacterium endophyticum]|uniref:ArsR family transcriptional regulator n=1 Tax=Brachybacterium endophyticum TaxID=2182385 RepID=A0A2U2RJY5_9MICO|nr:helix-turn-helix domain-containing protein [Brachybacterium endophyticum]PWH06115.1 ArsR family transcriptional regulator [Brachybacterium endophyticum]
MSSNRPVPQHAAPSTTADPTDGDRIARLEQRIVDLGARLDALEGRPAPDPTTPTASGTATDDDDPFWALNSLKSRMPEPGGVVFAGSVDPGMGHVEYQWGRPTDPLLRADWAERAERVAALGHPLRLSLLQRLLDGERPVAQLVDELDLASTGVAYHHLNALQGAGWVTSPTRGTWSIPPTRVVPLLAIITALEEA